ncbi:MAG: helix-turn-helix transcriptional regulator [Clostridia bacterium]|nr:helix-turn-helix transcriptional regulator [Clostridia bacterium]
MFNDFNILNENISISFLLGKDSKDSKQEKSFSCRRNMRPYSRFFYIRNGKIEFTEHIGDKHKKITATKGDIVYLPHNVEYDSVWEDENNIDYITVLFLILNKDNVNVNLSNEISIIAHDHKEMYLSYFNQIIELYTVHSFGSNFMCLSLLSKLIYIILNSSVKREIKKRDSIYTAIFQIENNPLAKVDVNSLAANCNLCPSSFRKKFKEITGRTPIEYKNHFKTQRAIELLLTGEYNIREVAEALDFPDEYYFSKTFKRFWGESPKKFCQHYYNK